MELQRHLHAVLQELDALVADEILVQLDLLVILGVHEHQHVALGVEELEFLLLQRHPLDGVGGAEALVQLAAVQQVLQFDLGEGAALARFDVGGLHRHPQAFLVLDHVAGLDGVAIDLHRGEGFFGGGFEGADPTQRIRRRQGWAAALKPLPKGEGGARAKGSGRVRGCGLASSSASRIPPAVRKPTHHLGLPGDPESVPVSGRLHRGGAAAWHTATTVSRSHLWAGSASIRGCHIAEIAIGGVRTGRSKPTRPSPVGSALVGLARPERGTSATKSVSRAMRIASGKPGTTATISRLSPSSSSASSTGPVNFPLRDATT